MCLHCQKDVKKESPQLIPCGRSSVIGESIIKGKSKQLCSKWAPILKSPFSPLQLHFTCQQWFLGAPLSHRRVLTWLDFCLIYSYNSLFIIIKYKSTSPLNQYRSTSDLACQQICVLFIFSLRQTRFGSDFTQISEQKNTSTKGRSHFKKTVKKRGHCPLVGGGGQPQFLF